MITLFVLLVTQPGLCLGYNECHWKQKRDGLFESQNACEQFAQVRYPAPAGITTGTQWQCRPVDVPFH